MNTFPLFKTINFVIKEQLSIIIGEGKNQTYIE